MRWEKQVDFDLLDYEQCAGGLFPEDGIVGLFWIEGSIWGGITTAFEGTLRLLRFKPLSFYIETDGFA